MEHKDDNTTQSNAAALEGIGCSICLCDGCCKKARAISEFPGLTTWIGMAGHYDGRSPKQAWMEHSTNG